MVSIVGDAAVGVVAIAIFVWAGVVGVKRLSGAKRFAENSKHINLGVFSALTDSIIVLHSFDWICIFSIVLQQL